MAPAPNWIPDPRQAEGSRVFFGALSKRGRVILGVVVGGIAVAVTLAILCFNVFPHM